MAVSLARPRAQSRVADIKLMQKMVTNETLESTKEMIRLFQESQDAGVRTLGLLHNQGEQLNRVGDNLNNISSNITKANRDLTRIEMAEEGWWCLAFCCCCSRKKKVKLTESEMSTNSNPIVHPYEQRRLSIDNPKSLPLHADGKGKTDDEIEKEIDRNLTHVFDTLLGLKKSAMQMGQVVQAHNSQLDNLNTKAIQDQDKLTAARTKAQRLL